MRQRRRGLRFTAQRVWSGWRTVILDDGTDLHGTDGRRQAVLQPGGPTDGLPSTLLRSGPGGRPPSTSVTRQSHT